MFNDDDMGGYWEALDAAQSVDDQQARAELRKYGVVGGYLLEWAREIPVGVSVLDDVEAAEAVKCEGHADCEGDDLEDVRDDDRTLKMCGACRRARRFAASRGMI